ncbi:hypothetical protein [Robiginitalea sp. IMCC43444]|uniref:hypothetical protein n=1 Tax=Robiginitalea sp. IMCC43444 TaxID=3459121 RepID=UPI0040412D7B
MKNLILITTFFFAICPGFGQDSAGQNTYKVTLSYQELLDRMAACTDSVFRLDGAVVAYDPVKDARFTKARDSLYMAELDTIYVQGQVLLKNIEFGPIAVENQQPFFAKVKFQKAVTISDAKGQDGLYFIKCKFDSETRISLDPEVDDGRIVFVESAFNSYVNFRLAKGAIYAFSCVFDPVNRKDLKNNIFFTDHEESGVFLPRNKFAQRDSLGKTIISGRLYTLRLWKNTFETDLAFSEMSIDDITMIGNDFQGLVDMTNVEFGSYKSELYYDQLGGNIGVYSNEDNAAKTWRPKSYEAFHDSIAAERFFNVYRRVTEHFRSRGNIRDYNRMYSEMKDFETMQLHYYYNKESSLSALFSWKMNQFLGIISDYGTRPTQSIIYSLYIVLIFALFYMLFPNSWDSEGRKRLIDRYTFFLKYLRKDAGIDEVFLENKQRNLMQYEEFKNLIRDSGQKVPKFFIATGLPIYKWAISGTTLSARILKRFDIIKGRWEDLPPSKRIWKSILITGAFIMTVIYDLFIKALNALMLSVNAFTTLGFGEIPIKGIPRYLAIIQGFVGWFMLTIFSVALISQLLN